MPAEEGAHHVMGLGGEAAGLEGGKRTGKTWVLAFIVLYFGFHRNKLHEAEEEGLKLAHLNNFPGSGILGLSLAIWYLALV